MTRVALRPGPALLGAASVAMALSAIGVAASSGLLLANATTSVPRGLYRKADPADATYVTFCLGARHRPAAWYGRLCSPDDPEGVPVLKRVAEVLDGHVIVEGDGRDALDSRVLGPVRLEEVRGWWVPVLQLGAADHGR
ncbi:MAG: hypothetical protein F4103_13900 [Boseongicola sp. SB0673_bin_14]|nr:hypothetical protein [Boseongicola sp. SB0673_bin_14]